MSPWGNDGSTYAMMKLLDLIGIIEIKNDKKVIFDSYEIKSV